MVSDPRKPSDDRVPILSDWSQPWVPFGGHAGLRSAGDATKMLASWRPDTTFEAAVGRWNTIPAALLETLATARRAVARITTSGVDHRGINGHWYGTGFLVAPNILLTNNHVLHNETVAAAARIEFDHELPLGQLVSPTRTVASIPFALDPARLFVTSPAEGGLDYSFVWISQKAAERFGTIPMLRGSFSVRLGEPVFIIHHPQGEPKQVSVDDTETLGINEDCLLYAADTDYGSSGACVFNSDGRLVALHHARRTRAELTALFPGALDALLDGQGYEVANEGIKISAIALDLEARIDARGRDAGQAAEVLAAVHGSDTLTGVFGVVGRQVRGGAAAGSDHARMLELYRAGDQDIDIGFWALDWLERQERDLTERAARAMSDINLDIWCLTAAPVNRVEALARKLSELFNGMIDTLRIDEGPPGRAGGISVLWHCDGVTIAPVPWPDGLAAVWNAIPEGQDAPLFDKPPARLTFCNHADGARIGNLICVDFSRFKEDELRRRLAAKILSRAIERSIELQGDSGDWLVGGDQQPVLSPEDLTGAMGRDYRLIRLRDETRGGALCCLRAPRTAVRKLYATKDLTQVEDGGVFVECLRDRTVDRYFADLADSRPITVRLSLAAAREPGDGVDLDRLVDGVFAGRDGEISVQTEAPRAAVSDRLEFEELGKDEFLRRNRALLGRMREEAGAGAALPVSETDLRVILYCEAGLRNGAIDPDARHSLGERGLLPLPSNIRDWIGAAAPPWDRPMSLDVNLRAYLGYLTALKNRVVVTRQGWGLYRDLFQAPGIAGNSTRQARLLAGIVHGYFVAANYRGRPVPFDHLLRGYAGDMPLEEMMAGTGYVHAGTQILTGRARNIEAALAG